MSANSNSASGNSWTLLTHEQSGVENVGPAAEVNKTEGHPAGVLAPKASTEVHTHVVKNSNEASAPEQCDPAHGKESEDTKEINSPEPHQVKLPGEDRAQLNALEDSTSVEDLSSWTPDHEEQDALTGHSESPESPGTDVDSFSDSYTHISPTSASSTHPASVCQGGEESHLKKTRTEDSKPGVELPENKEKEGDGLRKRKVTHLGSLDQGKTDAEDDDDGEEEEFQMPQREEEKIFSLNKCILAALILLGLGTIFFSGVLMDPDDEGDIDVRELKNKANKEWLNPEVSRDTPVGPEPPDIFNKQAMDSDEQILILHAQLQQHQGELKAVQNLAEEGEKERAKREELEKDYQRIKEELDRLPALQKELEQENERMKDESERAKRELEALPTLHRELEHLRAQVSQLTQSTERAGHAHPVASSGMPSSGNIRHVPPIDPQDRKHMKHWGKKSTDREPSREEKVKKKSGKKDGEKRRERVTEEEHVKEQKYWKKDQSKSEEEKSGKSKALRDEKEWKRDKKRDDGKVGRGDEGKKAFKDWDEKKGWKEEKKWKKDKHEEQDEHRRDKKDWKDAGKKKVKEDKEKEWKERGDKEWKTDKQSDRKEKKKEWKEKDEWKGVKEGKKGKSEDKFNDKTEKKRKGGEKEFHRFDEKEMEKNHWRGKEREWSTDEEWKKDKLKDDKPSKAYHRKHEEKKTHTEKEKQNKDEKERSNNEKYRDSHQMSSHHYNDHQKQHHEINPDNYWPRQRQKIQHNHRKKETCSGVTECAGVEGLSPVSLQDFEILLQSYLKKIQFPEDRASEKEDFSKLVREFFTDGVFVHDRMPFSEFVEDVADILEDLADGEESDLEESEEDDDDDDEEMEAFEREAMEMFALPEEAGRKESRKVRG